MVATHNTMTYLRSTNWFYNLVSPLWRCQNLDIENQIAFGARVFDLRIVEHDSEPWFAHGAVRLKGASPEDVITSLGSLGVRYRIVIEQGETDGIYEQFKDSEGLLGIWKKKGWVCLYKADDYSSFKQTDYSYVPFSSAKAWYKQIGSFLRNLNTIKGYAKKQTLIVGDDDRINWYDFPQLAEQCTTE